MSLNFICENKILAKISTVLWQTVEDMLQFALFAKTKMIFRTEILKRVKKQRCPIFKAIIVKKKRGEAIEERPTCIYKWHKNGMRRLSVFWVCFKTRQRPACSATEFRLNLQNKYSCSKTCLKPQLKNRKKKVLTENGS